MKISYLLIAQCVVVEKSAGLMWSPWLVFSRLISSVKISSRDNLKSCREIYFKNIELELKSVVLCQS